MQKNQGWVKIHRKITEWEWYDDINTSRLFIHLLVTCNHADGKWRGIEIKRGQRLASYQKLADEINLSVRNVRTSLKRLKSTHEVTSSSSALNTMITVINYDQYQQGDTPSDKQVTQCRQSSDKVVTTNKNDKNNKNVKNDIENGMSGGRPKNPKNPVGYLVTQNNPEKPKKPDSDSDSDSDIIIQQKKMNKYSSVTILEDEIFITELKKQFPSLSVSIEIEKMKDWLLMNGRKYKNYKAFARNWLRNNLNKK